MENAQGSWGDYFEFEIMTRSSIEKVITDWDQKEKVEAITRWVLYKDPKKRKMARADKNDGQVLLHRYLFDIPPGHKLEWINGNTLDCRRKNLQLIETKTGQIIPLYKPEIRQKSEVKGVYFHKASSRWHASAFYAKKRYSLGYFATEEEAADQVAIFRAEGPDSQNLKRNQRKGKN